LQSDRASQEDTYGYRRGKAIHDLAGTTAHVMNTLHTRAGGSWPRPCSVAMSSASSPAPSRASCFSGASCRWQLRSGRLCIQRRARRQCDRSAVHRHRTGRGRRRGSQASISYAQLRAASRQRRLLLVDHVAIPDRCHLRWRHQPRHAAPVSGDARLSRPGQGGQAGRDLRRDRARRRGLAGLGRLARRLVSSHERLGRNRPT
jgi:hypothetical protein